MSITIKKKYMLCIERQYMFKWSLCFLSYYHYYCASRYVNIRGVFLWLGSTLYPPKTSMLRHRYWGNELFLQSGYPEGYRWMAWNHYEMAIRQQNWEKINQGWGLPRKIHVNSHFSWQGFLTWLLIGWRLWWQPNRCQVWTFLLTKIDFSVEIS